MEASRRVLLIAWPPARSDCSSSMCFKMMVAGLEKKAQTSRP